MQTGTVSSICLTKRLSPLTRDSTAASHALPRVEVQTSTWTDLSTQKTLIQFDRFVLVVLLKKNFVLKIEKKECALSDERDVWRSVCEQLQLRSLSSVSSAACGEH
jgi:hypothetical protein